MLPGSSYLDELDRLLLDQSDDCMLLTQLDGFLAGVIVCPELIPPSRWLKCIWGGEDGQGALDIATMADLQHIIDLIMNHHNAILAALGQPGSYEPVFDVDTRNDDILWEIWIEGFAAAMDLAPGAWRHMARSGDAGCEAALRGIYSLRSLADGTKPLPREDEEQWHREAPDLIPIWIEMLHAWRLENDPILRCDRTRLAATIRVHAAPAKNTRSAAASIEVGLLPVRMGIWAVPPLSPSHPNSGPHP